MTDMTKRWIVVGVAVIFAGVVAGGVIAAQLRGVDDPESFVSAVGDAPVIRVADIPGTASSPARGVFVQATSNGYLCLWDAPSADSSQRQGGCDSLDDPLAGRNLSASLSYEGGPAARRVTDARLIGLVAPEVAAVQVLMSDGTHRVVPMRRQVAVATSAGRYRAFGYRFEPGDFRRGVGPVAVLALDSSGAEIDRQETGFAG